MASWRHVCWWEYGGPWLGNQLNWTVSWPWLWISCSSICAMTWQLSLWQNFESLDSWEELGHKSIYSQICPWAEHYSEDQGHPLFWMGNRIKKILICFTSLQISSPCWQVLSLLALSLLKESMAPLPVGWGRAGTAPSCAPGGAGSQANM